MVFLFYNSLNSKYYYYINTYNKDNHFFKNNRTLNMTFINIIIKVVIYKVFDSNVNAYSIVAYFVILKIRFFNIGNLDCIFL